MGLLTGSEAKHRQSVLSGLAELRTGLAELKAEAAKSIARLERRMEARLGGILRVPCPHSGSLHVQQQLHRFVLGKET